MSDPDSPSYPLDETHLSMLQDGIDKMKRAQQMHQQAVRAGIAVEGQGEQIQSLTKKLRQISDVYFPGRLR